MSESAANDLARRLDTSCFFMTIFLAVMMKRHPRRVVHVSCTDVGGKRRQFYAQLYVKFVLTAEYCQGRRDVSWKDRLELTKRRREALHDLAAAISRVVSSLRLLRLFRARLSTVSFFS